MSSLLLFSRLQKAACDALKQQLDVLHPQFEELKTSMERLLNPEAHPEQAQLDSISSHVQEISDEITALIATRKEKNV